MRRAAVPWCHHAPQGDRPDGDGRRVFVSKKERSFFFFFLENFDTIGGGG